MHDDCKDALGRLLSKSYTPVNMPRRKKLRYCRGVDGFNLFKPAGIPLSQLEIIELGLDELEAMRLCDLEDKQQEEAAETMGVSRGTVQRLLQSGRKKVLRAISEGEALSFSDAEHVCIGPRRAGWHGRGRRGGMGPPRDAGPEA
jgi:predicted DNA-binding protein (UPF0251 family)